MIYLIDPNFELANLAQYKSVAYVMGDDVVEVQHSVADLRGLEAAICFWVTSGKRLKLFWFSADVLNFASNHAICR